MGFVYDRRPDLKGAAPPAPAPAAAPHGVDERIMDLVVEKTAYPRDMLDLDLDLEADLGIDTVKQAEMFASIREMYNIPRDANVKLRDFSTLARVIGFVYDRRPDLKGASAPEPAPAAAPHGVAETIIDLLDEKSGYPSDMLVI